MDIPRITEDPAVARRKFEAYATASRQRHDVETAAIRDGYAALARGLELIDLHDVLQTAGADEKGLPRLAVCRADARFCYFAKRWLRRGPDGRFSGRQAAVFASSQIALDQEHRSSRRVEVPADVLTAVKSGGVHRAMVPIVPADLRPKASNGHLADLRHYHVLWEADWERVPVDPVLLEHVGGSLYAVRAEWDLTDLERAVMARRLVG